MVDIFLSFEITNLKGQLVMKVKKMYFFSVLKPKKFKRHITFVCIVKPHDVWTTKTKSKPGKKLF